MSAIWRPWGRALLFAAGLALGACSTTSVGVGAGFYGDAYYYDDPWYWGGCCVDPPSDIGPPPPRPAHPIANPPRPSHPVAPSARPMPAPRPAMSRGGGRR